MPQHNNEQFPMELSSQLVSIITTEHYNLQTGRSMAIAETNGRASLFVGAVSSGLIALTFVGQISHLGYLEHTPQLQPYFMLSAHDDRGETLSQEAMSTSWVQVFFNTAGMIAVINSVLIGSFVGLLLAVFSLPLWVCTSAGVVTFLVSVVLHQRYQWGQWMRLERNLPILFPSQRGE